MSTTRKQKLTAATAAALAFLVAPACSRSVDGQTYASTTASSSSTATTSTRTTISAPTTTATTTPLSVDEVVATAVSEAQTYWEVLGDVDTEFRVEQVSDAITCNSKRWRDEIMLYCDGVPGDNALRWNRTLTEQLSTRGGNDVVTFAIAHEVTHAAQDADGRDYPSRDAKEASADCGAGAYAAYTGADKAQADVAVKAIPQWDGARQRHFDYGWDNLVDPAACLDYTG